MNDHYFTPSPQSEHQPGRFETEFRGQQLTFDTDSGVFSRSGLDKGTEILLNALPEGMAGQVLDMGCGYGALGVSLAKGNPGLHLTMRSLGKQMDAGCAQALVFTVGHDAALLKQEMEKLAAYVGERETVTEEDIAAICIRSLECSVFQMVDAQVAGNNLAACQLLNSVLEGGEDRFMGLAMLLRQYRISYHMRCLLDEHAPANSLASLLGIPPFTLTRTQAQARRYPLEKLKAAYDYLFDLEYRLKSGQTPQEGSAETALFKLDDILNGDRQTIA